MAREKSNRQENEKKELAATFTGKCYGLVYRPHNGFANFAVAELEIKDGIVASMIIGEPYAAFEARARLELANNRLVDKMQQSYPPGYRVA